MPPAVVPPFESFVAPVVSVAVVVPLVVGVPLTGQVMLAPAATVAGAAGVQVPTVTPGGKPVTVQVAAIALAVAVALFEHLIVPVYAVPTVAVAGSPVRSGTISDAVVVMIPVAELLPPVVVPPTLSFEAPVVAVKVVAPMAVGVPVTGQEMLVLGATVAGGAGVQVPTVTPGGSPLMAHVAAVALTVASAVLVHLRVPL